MTPTECKDWLFDKNRGGLAVFLDTYSWKEQRARNLLAKWMHTYGPELTAQAMQHIKDKHPMEPVSRGVAWLQAVHDREAKKEAWKRTSGRIENDSLDRIKREVAEADERERRNPGEGKRVAQGLRRLAKDLAERPTPLKRKQQTVRPKRPRRPCPSLREFIESKQ